MKTFAPDDKGKEELSDLKTEYMEKRDALKIMTEENKLEDKKLSINHNVVISLKRKLKSINSQTKQIIQLKKMRNFERQKQTKKREDMIKKNTIRYKRMGKKYNPEKDPHLPKIDEEDKDAEYTQEMIDELEQESKELLKQRKHTKYEFKSNYKNMEEQTEYWKLKNAESAKQIASKEKEIRFHVTKLKKLKKGIKKNHEVSKQMLQDIEDERNGIKYQREKNIEILEIERLENERLEQERKEKEEKEAKTQDTEEEDEEAEGSSVKGSDEDEVENSDNLEGSDENGSDNEGSEAGSGDNSDSESGED